MTCEFYEYQDATRKTANLEGETIEGLALGLAGESGEVCDLVKKFSIQGHELDVEKVGEELGDVLWYVARVADIVGLDLDRIVEGNIKKLKARYPDGFSSEASINRE